MTERRFQRSISHAVAVTVAFSQNRRHLAQAVCTSQWSCRASNDGPSEATLLRQFSKNVIAERKVLGLCDAKGFQQGAGQSCVMPATIEVCNTQFLLGDMVLAAGDVPLGLRQMLKLLEPIHGYLAC